MKKNSVTLTFGNQTLTYEDDLDIISDINVTPGSKSVIFRKYNTNLLGITLINLSNNPKVFPEVEELIFNNNVAILDIPNSMFPNVKRLINNNTCKFKNVFYSDKNTIIDLHGYNQIDKHAFKGCKSINIINTEEIYDCAADAFADSAFSQAPFVNGMKIAGTILYDIDYDYDEICIPDYITCIADNIQMENIKRLRVTSFTNKSLIPRFKAKEIIIDKSVTDDNLIKLLKRCERLIFPDYITKYKVIDDLVYDNTGTILLMCPCYKRGNVVIPEGVEIINENAFDKCENIESVTFPESLICLNDSADKGNYALFRECKSLKEVHFNHSLNTITTLNGGQLFDGKNQITTLRIPEQVIMIGQYAFANMQHIKEIQLSPNLKVIGDYAFYKTLQEVNLPDSVKVIGLNAFHGVRELTTNIFHDNLLNSAIFDARSFKSIGVIKGNPTVEDCIKEYLVHFQIGIKDFYIPQYLNRSTIKQMEKIVVTGEFTNEELCVVWQDDVVKEITDIINIVYYKVSKSEIVRRAMKRRAKRIAMNLLNCGFEHLFIEFISFDDVLSSASLKALAEIVREKNMVSLHAYILNRIGITESEKKSYTTFKV